MHPFHRSELLLGAEGYDRVAAARICVIGLGGVGSHAAEAIVRSGAAHITLVDFDKVCLTNVNRQLHATRKTVGQPKSGLMAERARQINPRAEVRELECFYEAETSDEILGEGFDYVLDCIDNMTAKLHLLETCVRRDIPVISAMGAGGRLDPTRVRVTDLSRTHTDPFARIVREQLRKRGIDQGVRSVWTDESPNTLDAHAQHIFRCICPGKDENTKHSCEQRHQIQGTSSWMPAIFGLTMAGAVVNELIGRTLQPEKTPQKRLPPSQKTSRARKKELMAAAGFERLGER
jgi:tRNA A37 threonylcarbamoyladenosine dehydratase